jgi:hypothetical protein
MKVNTAQAIETANNVYSHYGSWEEVRRASVFVDGKYVIQPKNDSRAQGKERKTPAPATRKAG